MKANERYVSAFISQISVFDFSMSKVDSTLPWTRVQVDVVLGGEGGCSGVHRAVARQHRFGPVGGNPGYRKLCLGAFPLQGGQRNYQEGKALCKTGSEWPGAAASNAGLAGNFIGKRHRCTHLIFPESLPLGRVNGIKVATQ